MTTQRKAEKFRQMHEGPCFIMPNAWNAGSAVMLEQAGFESIATTSAGIAFSHAMADSTLSFEMALQETAAIVAAVNVPVSMDSENLYTHDLNSIHGNLKKILETGVVGVSIEDYTGNSDDPYYDIEVATDRVSAADDARRSLQYPVTLTARSECYLYGHPDPFAESVRRVNRYHEAGADCLYVPGLRDIETIRALVREVDAPVNVVMGLSGSPFSLSELAQAGVTRVSIGGSLARATFGLMRKACEEMQQYGTFNYAAQQVADSELCDLFSKLK
ncbi:MAG: isocitrate lyase/phosphoenolpyruvate mutase family protein [Pseudomonadota bacterium]